MLKVDTKILADRQAKITVTVDAERLQKALQSAASRISRQAKIPGFRPGKAPYHIVQRHFGDDVIFDEALEPLGQAVYKEALDESGVEPYGPGSLDDISRDPLVLSFTVPLVPEIDLGDYRKVRIPHKADKVSDKDVDHALEHLRDEQATLEPVERALEMGDVGLLNIVGVFTDDEENPEPQEPDLQNEPDTSRDFLRRDEVRVLISKEATYPVPGFPAKALGMTAGEARSFDITLSAKDKDIDETLRGRTIHFEITCKQVYRRELPELNDEFAVSLGEYANVAALRDAVRKDLEVESARGARMEYVDKVFEKLLGGIVKVSYPPAVVEEQIDEMVTDFDSRLRRQGLNVEDYMRLNKLTKEKIREDFRDTAEQQIKRGLILGELSAVEQIKVTDEEIEDEIQTRLLTFGAQAPMLESLMKSAESRRSIASRLLTDKTLDRLVLVAQGTAPPLEATHPADAKTTKKRTGKATKAALKARE